MVTNVASRRSFREELDQIARDIEAGVELPAIDPERLRLEIEENERVAAEQARLELDAAPLFAGLFIPGAPAGFAAGGKTKAWQETLSAAIPLAPTYHLSEGFTAEFAVPAASASAPGYDLDNLLDPVFSRLVNDRGWFGGRRPNVRWVATRKYTPGEPKYGARLTVARRPPRTWIDHRRRTALDGVFMGALPRRGHGGDYEDWVSSAMRRQLEDVPVGVEIRLSDLAANLGDIADGPIKAMIDGLWPILGGSARAPNDRCINRMLVEKGVAEPGIRVRVIETAT